MSTELSQDKEMEERIDELEDEIAQHPQLECDYNHLFVDGMYARTMLIPEGAIVTGKRHIKEHINIIVKGVAKVYTGDSMELITAPSIFVSKAGTRKAVFAIEDVIWTTIHTTEQTDPELAVEELTEKGRVHILKALEERKDEKLKLT